MLRILISLPARQCEHAARVVRCGDARLIFSPVTIASVRPFRRSRARIRRHGNAGNQQRQHDATMSSGARGAGQNQPAKQNTATQNATAAATRQLIRRRAFDELSTSSAAFRARGLCRCASCKLAAASGCCGFKRERPFVIQNRVAEIRPRGSRRCRDCRTELRFVAPASSPSVSSIASRKWPAPIFLIRFRDGPPRCRAKTSSRASEREEQKRAGEFAARTFHARKFSTSSRISRRCSAESALLPLRPPL